MLYSKEIFPAVLSREIDVGVDWNDDWNDILKIKRGVYQVHVLLSIFEMLF